MTHRALLHADGGAAAAEAAHFFRSAAFLAADGVTHSLVVDHAGGRLALPLRVRDIPGGGCDAISPYGFPGGRLDGAALDPSTVDFVGTGLVSLFVRDRVRNPVLRGGTERNRLLLHEPSAPRAVREAFRYQARRNLRRGYAVDVVPGPEVGEADVAAFAACYTETMHHAGATRGYFFDLDYLSACLTSPCAWLVATRDPGGRVVSAAVLVSSDGMLHYFLGGTRDDARAASPAKTGFVRMVDLADEWDLPLNLGGGMRAGDGLEHFKSGFANTSAVFTTHEIVGDPRRYGDLAAGVEDAGSFFPAYRA